nr:MAG TPA: hypothetical protein [Caudoviricetes sp.]
MRVSVIFVCLRLRLGRMPRLGGRGRLTLVFILMVVLSRVTRLCLLCRRVILWILQRFSRRLTVAVMCAMLRLVVAVLRVTTVSLIMVMVLPGSRRSNYGY